MYATVVITEMQDKDTVTPGVPVPKPDGKCDFFPLKTAEEATRRFNGLMQQLAANPALEGITQFELSGPCTSYRESLIYLKNGEIVSVSCMITRDTADA